MPRTSCPNFNHGRVNAPVRCCPLCGESVNAAIAAKHCGDTAHAARRKKGDLYCIDCGFGLRTQR